MCLHVRYVVLGHKLTFWLGWVILALSYVCKYVCLYVYTYVCASYILITISDHLEIKFRYVYMWETSFSAKIWWFDKGFNIKKGLKWSICRVLISIEKSAKFWTRIYIFKYVLERYLYEIFKNVLHKPCLMKQGLCCTFLKTLWKSLSNKYSKIYIFVQILLLFFD